MGGGSHSDKRRVATFYRCRGWVTGQCKGHMIRGDQIECYVAKFIQEQICSKSAMARIKTEISRQATERRETESEGDQFRDRLAALKRQIDNVRRKWVIADADDADALRDILEDLKDQKERVQENLHQVEGVLTDPRQHEQQALGHLMRLRDDFDSGDPLNMRAVLGEVFESITLTFEQGGYYRPLERGEMVLRAQSANLPSTVGAAW